MLSVRCLAGCIDDHVGTNALDASMDAAMRDATMDDAAMKSDAGPTSDAASTRDAGPGCGLRTCASAGASCGPIGDGCGALIDCGSCTAPRTCGGGGVPNVCGGTSGCVPRTCSQVGANCGPVADGCGGLLNCGTCGVTEACGLGGPSVCGPSGGGDSGDGGVAVGCVAQTCDSVGANCGPIGNGCGDVINCGGCTRPYICGGGGVPSVCGDLNEPEGGVACTGLCMQQVDCVGTTTSLSGVVYTPKGDLPLYNVNVFVPNAALDPIATGASCDRCETPISGNPLVHTTTDAEGKFVLHDVPAGHDIPLVIQVGKWRRQVTIPDVTPCANTSVPAELTRLPRNRSEGNIPKIALTTGGADALECLIRKIGIDDAEITNPGGDGRSNLYAGAGSDANPATTAYQAGFAGGQAFPDATTLWNSAATLASYDVVLLSCEGISEAQQTNKSPAALAAMKTYLDAGGRVFASHWHHYWITHGPAPMPSVATITERGNPSPDVFTATTDIGFPKGASLASWMFSVGGSSTYGQFIINQARDTIDMVHDAVATRWVYTLQPASVQYLSFNTPIEAPAAQQCGRMVLSDIHVSADDSGGPAYPSGCKSTTLSAQEKALIFMLFDLSACLTEDRPPTCTPRTCAQANADCGPVADGCGGLLDCGSCAPPQTCGGGGTPSVCGGRLGCQTKSCADQNLSCGPAGDGCGGLLDCGGCTLPDTCGGGGVIGQCGAPPCNALTCQGVGAECGLIGDGCGGSVDCGSCASPLACGGSGVPNHCGAALR